MPLHARLETDLLIWLMFQDDTNFYGINSLH